MAHLVQHKYVSRFKGIGMNSLRQKSTSSYKNQGATTFFAN